jgi:hypothetical protein
VVGVSEFDATPPRAAIAPAAIAAAVALLPGASSGAGLAVGFLGAALLLYGAREGRHVFVTLGGAALAVSVVLGAATGIDAVYALVGGVGAVVAYDAGEHAVGLGVDVGEHARVGQSVLVHVGSTASVCLLVAAGAYVVYLYGPSSLPLMALLTLLLGGVFLAYVLED